MSLRTVCFLCTGNYYRSRFAEELFNHLAARMRLEWRARSAGLGLTLNESLNLGPIAAQTLEALKQRSISIGEPVRYPRPATLEDFVSADLVVALREAEHRALMRRRFPEWERRITYWHVPDLDLVPADSAIAEIETLVLDLITRLKPRESA